MASLRHMSSAISNITKSTQATVVIQNLVVNNMRVRQQTSRINKIVFPQGFIDHMSFLLERKHLKEYQKLAHDQPTSFCFKPIRCNKKSIFSLLYFKYLILFCVTSHNLMRGNCSLKMSILTVIFILRTQKVN